MKVIARLGKAEEPVDCFQSLVGLSVFIMNMKRRRVSDQNIEGTSISRLIQQQAWNHPKSPQIGLALRILICRVGTILDRSAEAADQKTLKAYHVQVQVGTAFHMGKGIVGVVGWVMVAGYIKQRNVQKSQQILQIGIRQVSASKDQLDLAKVTAGTKSIKTFDNFITYGKNVHNGCIVPQNDAPCKG